MSPRIGNVNGGTPTQEEHIVDFKQAREQRLEEKRRTTERIFFHNLLSVFSMVSESKMLPIDLIEVSEDGLSFQIPYNPDHIWPKDTDEIPIRFYFSQNTYLEIQVKIQNSRPSIENHCRYVRFGCAVDRELKSYPAYQLFVKFLKLYAEHAHKDLGDVSVFYL